MQETSIYQFKSTLERKRFAYNQRITNDKEELEKEKTFRAEERKDVMEKACLKEMESLKEIEAIKAKAARLKSEITAQTDAMINEINAETDLMYNEIIAESKIIEIETREKAIAEAAEIVA